MSLLCNWWVSCLAWEGIAEQTESAGKQAKEEEPSTLSHFRQKPILSTKTGLLLNKTKKYFDITEKQL